MKNHIDNDKEDKKKKKMHCIKGMVFSSALILLYNLLLPVAFIGSTLRDTGENLDTYRKALVWLQSSPVSIFMNVFCAIMLIHSTTSFLLYNTRSNMHSDK